MTIAVTGATGFVGQGLLDLAGREGVPVKALTRRDQPARDGVEWVRGDLEAKAALRAGGMRSKNAGTECQVETPEGSATIRSRLVGNYNVSNTLAVLSKRESCVASR
mgnify:CR=1 FL=1